MSLFRRQLEVIMEQQIPVDEITVADLYPFWEDSDQRLSRFSEEEKSLTIIDIINKLEENDNLQYRLLLCIVLEGFTT